MNTKIVFQPASLVVGALLGALVFLSMSQGIVSTPLRVEYLANPRDMVQIQEGASFIVPAGKLFVLTALGGSTQGQAFYLRVNGQAEVTTFVGSSYSGGSMTVPVPSGFTVAAGMTIEALVAAPQQGYGRAWGYLVNA